MQVARPLPLLLILLWGGACPGWAAPEERAKSGVWQRVELAASVPKALVDLRSPVVPYEQRIASGEALALRGERLRLTLRPGGKGVDWRRLERLGKGAKVPTRGTLALPGLLTLPDLSKVRYTLHVRAAPSGDALLVGSAVALTLPLKGEPAYLVDMDLDGVLGSPGDGYVAPESRTVGHWHGEAWNQAESVAFRKTPRGSWERLEIPCPHPTDRDHAAAWRLLQWRRQQCGLPCVAYDRALEAGMHKHAEYLVADDSTAHSEDPRNSRYSPEGDRAARNCVIGFEETSALAGLQMQLATLYHRSRPLQPGLTHTAVVFHKGFFLLDIFSRRGGPLNGALLVYPPHGMTNVRLRFHPNGEHPMPVPKEDQGNTWLGTAINLFSEPMRLLESLPAVPRIHAVYGRTRKTVDGHFHYPGEAPHAGVGASNRGNVGLVPKKPLKAKTRYDCTAKVVLPGGETLSYEWWFDTRKKTKKARRR